MKALAFLMLFTAMAFAGSITPELREIMGETDGGNLIRILIKPIGMVDVDYVMNATQGMDRAQTREFAAEVMKDRAASSQAGILEQLSTLPTGSVDDVHPFWIVNAIAVSMTPEAIVEISNRDDILYIRFMRRSDILIEPVDEYTPESAPKGNAWGVDKIGAPDVWAMGYEGSGIIVSVVDTGVNYNHVDLHNNMWHDTAAGFHYGWDFADNDGDPMDTNSHGTHCAGSVASNGNAGTTCGVAPLATIMALRVGVTFSDEQDVWDAFQFSIDYGADVISTSLGWPQSQSPDRYTWRETENNVLAAGICHAIAAGNEGGNPGTPGDIRTPGDVPPPWLHPNQITIGGLSAVVTVGATDSNDNIASFSSRGYSTWEFEAPWYDYPDDGPDIGLIDPDISGPGVNITSCSHTNNSGYTVKSGTSMSTPHLAGCMALILEANPALSPAQVDSLLEITSLDLGDTGKDNVFGAGRVQIYEAVVAALNVGVDESSGSDPESGLILSVAGSNPSFGSLIFDLYTGVSSDMDISVFDITGRKVAVVQNGSVSQGNHSFTWSVPGNIGSGIYFLRASSDQDSVSERFTLLR
ncbi:MAG: S8 family peptidase [Candidatus Fermentibacteraceae bacterium]|nr:S8 family peptidase [Candidatus Fermentibacteraceae bacterium]